jgi:hypothetical protein
VKKRIVATTPVIIAIISITLMSCGDDNGSTGPTPGGEEQKTGYSYFMPLTVGNEWIYEYVWSDETGIRDTGEYYIRIVEKLDYYHGFEAYLAQYKDEPWEPYVRYMVLACDGDKCYRFTSPWWEYVVEDDMESLSWSQTGLITTYKLQFIKTVDLTLPAGAFKNCKQLQIVLEGSSSTDTYEEYYAKDAGLVWYRNHRRHDSEKWDQYEYRLKSYEVKKPL